MTEELLEQARWLQAHGFRVIAIDQATEHITIKALEVQQ